MDNKDYLNNLKQDEASLLEGGGTANGGDGGSGQKTPSVCPADSQLPQGGSLCSEQTQSNPWYVDLTREEAAAYSLLMAKERGPLRTRKTAVITAALCSMILLGLAFGEFLAGVTDTFDYFTALFGVLIWLPALYVCLILPHSIRKKAVQHYDRSVSAGIVYAGQLTVTDEYVEKVSPSATAHVRLDDRAYFIETADMMVFITVDSPGLVLPARCLTDEMAVTIRRAADRLPPRNRRFVSRIQPKGEIVTPVEAVKPELLWTATFTYTPEEYVTVARSSILYRFWRMAPAMTPMAFIGALVFGWSGENITPAIGYFLLFMGIFVLMNLAFPLMQNKRRVGMMTAHDLTVKVGFDTTALRMVAPRGSEMPLLWCDVKHVYDRDSFVEIDIVKSAGLLIPKRVIEDIPAFEAALKRCREGKNGEQ